MIKAFDEKSSEVIIECLGKNCPFNNWFHLKCVKLTDVPVDDWFCMANAFGTRVIHIKIKYSKQIYYKKLS